MIRFLAVAGGLLICMPPVLHAQQGPIRSGTAAEGTLSFDGHATVADFTGVTTTVTGELTGADELRAVHGWVQAPVNTLKTKNDHRDRDMNKSMESDKYPDIRFELDSVSAGTGTADSLPATLHGRMLIHGVTRAVALPAVLGFAGDGVRVRSTFPLNLKDYDIGGLSKMLGMLKMYPDIVVHVDVRFTFSG